MDDASPSPRADQAAVDLSLGAFREAARHHANYAASAAAASALLSALATHHARASASAGDSAGDSDGDCDGDCDGDSGGDSDGDSLSARGRSIAILHEMRRTLHRLIVNVSCRMKQRDPTGATLPKQRELLSHAHREAAQRLRAMDAPLDPLCTASTKRPLPAPPIAECAQLDLLGARHLCVHRCYFFSFEPARRLRALRLALEASLLQSERVPKDQIESHAASLLDGWRVHLCEPQQRRKRLNMRNDRSLPGATDAGLPALAGGVSPGVPPGVPPGVSLGVSPAKELVPSSEPVLAYVSPTGVRFSSQPAALRRILQAEHSSRFFASAGPPSGGSRQGSPGFSHMCHNAIFLIHHRVLSFSIPPAVEARAGCSPSCLLITPKHPPSTPQAPPKHLPIPPAVAAGAGSFRVRVQTPMPAVSMSPLQPPLLLPLPLPPRRSSCVVAPHSALHLEGVRGDRRTLRTVFSKSSSGTGPGRSSSAV